MMFLAAFISLLIATTVSASSWATTPFNPASIPLAVRSPYLSAWLPQGAVPVAVNQAWPQFWDSGNLGWAGYISVDGTTYRILGNPNEDGYSPLLATQQSMQFTATSTSFLLSAGSVNVSLTFINPVEPSDLVKQSTPFSYLTVQVISTDGQVHAVSVYTDITAEWVLASDNTQVVAWQSTTSGPVLTHQVMLQGQQEYTEYKECIMQGAVYYSITNNGTSTTYQTGHDTDVRGQFITYGTLANTLETNFRAISDNWPVFGFAQDLGNVTGTSDTVVFAIGHVRDPAVEYIIAGGASQARSLYAWSAYPYGVGQMIAAFLEDYPNAVLKAYDFDVQVERDASVISSSYTAIVQLSIQQALSALEVTISQSSDGLWNTSDVLVFLKEISSGGRVNTVDVIMATWPVLLYTNSTLGKYLLLGLFEYQATAQWPETYAIPDLGSTYPKAIGHNDGNAEAMPLEECGNMLIMTLSYTQKTQDTSIITRYADLLNQWTGYLVVESLIPAYQSSTDDFFAGILANQTNLAIKGVIGIQAMANISGMLGDTSNQQNYSSIAASYVPQILSYATATDGQQLEHLELSYGNDSSWGLSYNLYTDKLLGTNLFPEYIYEMQTTWYATVANTYGVPLDTRNTFTRSDWQMWTAAFMTNTTTRDMFIDSIYRYAVDSENSVPLSDWYDTVSGVVDGFAARPVVGGHLALLVLPSS